MKGEAVDAVVLRDDGVPRVETVEVDEPRAGEVLVRVAASGVCGSDLHVVAGTSNAGARPMVMGHEGAGTVESVGPGVRSVAPGQPVVLALYGPCHACEHCHRGRFVLCDGAARTAAIAGRMEDGSTRLHTPEGVALHPFVGIGSLAEHAVLREQQVVAIDDDLPIDVLALAGCGVTTGLGAVFNIAEVAPGEHVLVVGCGGVGLNVIQAARLAGAATVIAADLNPARLALAAAFGATHVVDTNTEELAAAVRRIAPAGVEVAFEVVGRPELVAEAFTLTRAGGRCVMVGAPPAGATIPIPGAALMFGERRLFGCLGGSNTPQRDIPRIAELYRNGAIKLDELVSERVPLHEFERAFDDTRDGRVARALVVMEG
jgi:S-(hydroxymethyl)glutathione dehydrogenase / alcohol dehydrogenase